MYTFYLECQSSTPYHLTFSGFSVVFNQPIIKNTSKYHEFEVMISPIDFTYSAID
jgi:hypothetical protein